MTEIYPETACPNTVGFFENRKTGQRIPARCKSPTCEHCGPIYKKRLLDDVSYGAGIIQRNGRRWRFMTLTTGPRTDQERLSTFWNRFRAILRKHGYRPEFFKVTEFQQNGQRHFHILIDVFVPWNLIRYAWELATEHTANFVNIKAVQVRAAAAYMFKYMTKQSILSNQFRKYERRYTFSRGFPRLSKDTAREKSPDSPWTFTYAPDNKNLLLTALRDYIETAKGGGLFIASSTNLH